MKKLAYILLLVTIFPFVGCEAIPFVSPIVTGVVKWIEGEAHKYYDNETDVLYRATKRSLRELDIPITTDEPGADGYYHIVAGGEDRFNIRIRRVQKGISEVKIRVNFMGDKPYAEMIYSRIDTSLDRIDFDNGIPSRNRGKKKLFSNLE
jgi:hypothetical protein